MYRQQKMNVYRQMHGQANKLIFLCFTNSLYYVFIFQSLIKVSMFSTVGSR